MVAKFRDSYPLIEINLVTTYAYSDLSRRDADLAIRFSETPEQHLVGRRLPPFKDAIYAHPDYIAQHWKSGHSKAAKWVSWVDQKLFMKRIRSTPFAKAKIDWVMPSIPLQAEAAKQGLGMAFLPCIVGDSDPILQRVPNSGTYDGRPAWLLTHPDLRTMERVRVFSKFLAEEINARKEFLSGIGIAEV